jgi:RNA polymerase sigma-70 factor, ECF subfamily
MNIPLGQQFHANRQSTSSPGPRATLDAAPGRGGGQPFNGAQSKGTEGQCDAPPVSGLLSLSVRYFFPPPAKDFLPSRKYADEDVATNKGAGVADDEQSSLIADLQKRDRSAWSLAVDRHLDEVYGFVFHLVGGDRAVAEDLNQETWLEALAGIDQCNAAQGTFRNWLFGIARKRVALHYRRRALAGNPRSLGHPCEKVALLGDVSVLPEDVLEQVEQKSLVRAAMLVIPDDRRKALIWKYAEGLSVDSIAVRMGRTTKAVESLLSRAREQMRSLLRGYVIPRGGERRRSKESSNE